MNCEMAGEYISALCDGQKIQRLAAEHIGSCRKCQLELKDYAAMGTELRRLASLDETAQVVPVVRKLKLTRKIAWWQRGLTTMRIPKLAFGVMLSAIIALSSGLVIVQVRAAAAAGGFIELKYKLPQAGESGICVMRADGSQKDNLCDFVHHGREGVFLMNTRIVASLGDRTKLGVRAKYIPGDGDAEVKYREDLFKDVPESVLASGQKQQIEVADLGTIQVEGQYVDHIPPLIYRPQETLDPAPKEFRIVAPVLVRDNKVVAQADGESIETGASDATLMLYVPSQGRYLMSIAPFEGAVEGSAHLGQITFILDRHKYLLLTSMPITVSDHVWVKNEPDFKPSERMVRESDAHDDQIMFLVRSLRTLEQSRIPH